MKTIYWFPVAAALTAACSVAPRAETPAANARPASVTVGHAEMSELPGQFEAGGIVRARVTALIASRMLAPIVDVAVRPGDRVRRGQVLVSLESSQTQAVRAQAAAAGVGADEAARAADADLRAAESAAMLARTTHDRIRTLFERRSATEQELDQANASLAAADAQRAGAASRVAAAAAARDAAHAAAEAAAIAVSYGQLIAPFDGIVTERRADPGSMAAPGAPILTLEDPSSYRLEVPLDEARGAIVARGDAVDVRVASAESVEHGRVGEIARLDPASHSFLVKIDLAPVAFVRSGLFGRATFSTTPRRALTVPASAVVTRGQLTFVFLVDREQRLVLRPVSVGPTIGARTEILSGVREHDAVVLNPSSSLADGQHAAGAGQ